VDQIVVRGKTLPREVRDALQAGEDDEVAFVDTARGIVVVPADQAWYWPTEWQEGERPADKQISAGELSQVFESAEEMFDHLDGQVGD
jgi:bifunctional DNA-binding transcriptional regulator/antitoxin component of YhaV-PrlF toxin-antitoxin module